MDMPKYIVRDTRAGESPHYHTTMGHAPRSVKLQNPPKIGDHLTLAFMVDAIPECAFERRDCEVVSLGVVGRWPFRKNVLYVKPSKLERTSQTPQTEAPVTFGSLRFNSYPPPNNSD